MGSIAVVDDEPDIPLVIQKALQKEGYSVETFTDPVKALANVTPGKYAILITDIKMPGMNGFELYRAAKKIDDNIRVGFMTAFDIHQDEFKKVFPGNEISFF